VHQTPPSRGRVGEVAKANTVTAGQTKRFGCCRSIEMSSLDCSVRMSPHGDMGDDSWIRRTTGSLSTRCSGSSKCWTVTSSSSCERRAPRQPTRARRSWRGSPKWPRASGTSGVWLLARHASAAGTAMRTRP
jgi:hypothetical protein